MAGMMLLPRSDRLLGAQTPLPLSIFPMVYAMSECDLLERNFLIVPNLHQNAAEQNCSPVFEGLWPAKLHENRTELRCKRHRSGEVEFTVEQLRPFTCLIRSVRD